MSGAEKLKLWAAGLLVLIVVYIAGYAELAAGVRFAAAAVGLIIAGVLVIYSQPGRDFSHFVRSAGNELRKVVWPQKQEVMQMTAIVFVFLTIVTIFLWSIDLIIGFLLQQLVG